MKYQNIAEEGDEYTVTFKVDMRLPIRVRAKNFEEANVYGPYYGKSLLLNYFENLNITHSTYRAFSLNSLSNKEVFEKLRNIKSSQKGENNGNN